MPASGENVGCVAATACLKPIAVVATDVEPPVKVKLADEPGLAVIWCSAPAAFGNEPPTVPASRVKPAPAVNVLMRDVSPAHAAMNSSLPVAEYEGDVVGVAETALKSVLKSRSALPPEIGTFQTTTVPNVFVSVVHVTELVALACVALKQ